MNTDRNPIKKATRIESVMNSALWHLGRQDMTESEVLSKLRVKTDNEEWITDTINKLKDFGYLKSDQVFAEQFSERAFMGEYGSSYILKKLKQKGISEALILECIDKVKNDKNIDEQTILIDRVNHYYQSFTMSKEKLYSTLQNRGFSYAQVREAVNQHVNVGQLQSKLEIKAEKADLEKEVLKLARKGKGLIVIRQELRQRKIDISDLDAVLNRLMESEQIDFFQQCLEQLEKKSYDVSNRNERSKAYGMLSRKGFSSEEIQYALSEASEK